MPCVEHIQLQTRSIQKKNNLVYLASINVGGEVGVKQAQNNKIYYHVLNSALSE